MKNEAEIVGLSTDRVKDLRQQFGWNEVRSKKPNSILLYLKKFWGPSAWMIEAIVALSWFLGKIADGWVALSLLVLNSIIGFLQEQRAEHTVELLRQRLQVAAKLLRDGQWTLLPAREVVPSDILRVRLGDIIPADIRIITGEIEVDQSMLTGESVEVKKKSGDTAYSGSLVRRGECTAEVLSIGGRTFFGQTIELVQTAKPKLHLDEIVGKLVKWLFLAIGTLVLVLIIGSAIDGMSLLEILPLSLVLLMSAIPVALPVMFSVSTAKAARDLSKQGVLVTRLSAAEDAATMDILCTDKTGTITENHLSVADLIPMPGFNRDDVLLCAALASDKADQDSIDDAILEAAEKNQIDFSGWQKGQFNPFSPETRRTEATVYSNSQEMIVTKGAALSVAEWCGSKGSSGIRTSTEKLGGEGYRSIGVGRKKAGASAEFVGIIALRDPPCPDSKALIERLRFLGIEVKMLTGDAHPVAQAIATEIGLGKIAPESSGLDISDALKKYDGLASVYPQTKFQIINTLQAQRRIVGMTGDGVNDAPALRKAEVGIAVQEATDAAKSAASVVLTTKGLTGIVSLVENGRAVYQRILTWMINKVSRTVLKAGFIVLAYFTTGKFVISAIAMLVLVLMTDFAKIALATDVVIISPRPDTWNIGPLGGLGVLLGVLMVGEALILLLFGTRILGIGISSKEIHTYVFLVLLFLAIFSILSIRERRRFWSSWPSPWLLMALAADSLIGILIGSFGFLEMPPIPWSTTVWIIGGSGLFSLVLNDFAKSVFLKRLTMRPCHTCR